MKFENIEFELRDLLVGVPALGAVIAVTWEVGKFTASGGFNLFSLSEHILASLQALPIALIVAMVSTIIFASNSDKNRPDVGKPPSHGFNRVVGMVIVFGLIALLGGLGIFFHIAMIVSFALVLAVVTVLAFQSARITFYWPVLAAGLLAVTLAGGNDWARGEMNSMSLTYRYLDTIETKSGERRGRVLMSGDRGMLIYQPDVNEITFLRSDEIKSVKWKRISVFDLPSQRSN